MYRFLNSVIPFHLKPALFLTQIIISGLSTQYSILSTLYYSGFRRKAFRVKSKKGRVYREKVRVKLS